MLVQVMPLSEFVHDRMTAHEGQPMMMAEATAKALERAGLVRIKLEPRRVDEALAQGAGATVVEAGKAQDDGLAPPSSASPAGRVSPIQTLKSSKSGVIGKLKVGR